jgi:integrase
MGSGTGHNIKKVQELLGHKDIRTTMIYLHVMEGGTTGVRSPLDTLDAWEPAAP